MKDAYTYGSSAVPWAGHVNRKGIHISWNHFQQGYAVRNDRYNVGVHEMAHALEYEFTLGNYASEELWQGLFKKTMSRVKEALFTEQMQKTGLYTEQGIANSHECWAESLELFFENPADLLRYHPDLFDHIKLLLNQNPLNSKNA